MAVKEILDKRVIDLDMTAKTKDEVIRHLAGLLHEAGYVDDLEGYIKDVDKVGIAVGRTHDMVEWESYDGEPSQLFFLFAVPSDNEGAKDHLRLIAELAGKLGNDETMKKLQTAKTYEELLEAFS